MIKKTSIIIVKTKKAIEILALINKNIIAIISAIQPTAAKTNKAFSFPVSTLTHL